MQPTDTELHLLCKFPAAAYSRQHISSFPEACLASVCGFRAFLAFTKFHVTGFGVRNCLGVRNHQLGTSRFCKGVTKQ